MLRFSILVPSRNQSRFLEQSLQSALGQPAKHIDIVVVDGASSDGTQEILQRYQQQLRWISEPDQGTADALNKGLRMTDGEVIGWLNADDLYVDDALPQVSEFLTSRPEVDVVYGAIHHIDTQGEILRRIDATPWSHEQLQAECFLQLPAVFFRRRVLQRCAGFDERFNYWADYDFWLRLADAGVRFEPLPVLLANRRIHPDGRRLGSRCPQHQAASLAELNTLVAGRRGRVSARRILQYAQAKALTEGVSRETSASFDRAVMRHAVQGMDTWNRPAGRWFRAAAVLRLFGRHLGREIGQLVRHPRFVFRFLPEPGREFMHTHLRRKIFKLRVHQPRPVKLPARYHATMPPADPPTISIVTPNLNQGAYLEQTIQSVTQQGYPCLEYVVQDGGSTDNSVEIVRRSAQLLTRWDSSPDRGQAHAINRGMKLTTGQIMAFLNSDDVLLPGSLAYVAHYFQRHPQVDVVYGHRLLIDEQGREIGRWVLPPHDDHVIPWADFIPQETMFWRRTAWERVGGGLDESFHFALDWDLILRFREAGLRFERLPRFLGAFRVTEEQKTTQLVQTVGLREMGRLRQRVLGREPSAREIRQVVRPYIRRHLLCDTLYTLGLARY